VRTHKAIFHCHSAYSDGEFSLAELRELSLASGVRFICISDHADSFDELKLRAYLGECAELSDEKFAFINGLEYTCERNMHVLGYGMTSLINSRNPQEIIRQIKAAGGVAVIAHPPDAMFEWIESFEDLPHGIEVWNTKYDGQDAPRPQTFQMLARLQERDGAMRAFYGQDLHWRTQPRVLFNLVNCETISREKVLDAMRRGDFAGIKDEFRLPSSGRIDAELLDELGAINQRYMRRQKLFKRMKNFSGRFGKSLPKPIKARIRNLFS
jgi:predicted metal-dependent phosphoesterase TrpH